MSLGLGSVIASALSAAPWIASVGRHKNGVFLSVAVLLAFNYWIAIARPRRQACPPGEVCHIDGPAMRVNRWLYLGVGGDLPGRGGRDVRGAVVGREAIMKHDRGLLGRRALRPSPGDPCLGTWAGIRSHDADTRQRGMEPRHGMDAARQ